MYQIRYKIRHHPTDENYFWGSKGYAAKNTAPYGCPNKVFTDFKTDFEKEYPDTTLPAEMTSLFHGCPPSAYWTTGFTTLQYYVDQSWLQVIFGYTMSCSDAAAVTRHSYVV